MESSAAKLKERKAAQEIIGAFRKLGVTLGHEVYRVVLYENGGGEVEFNSSLSWECLVLRWEDLDGLSNLFTRMANEGRPEGHAALRKKCTKCFMHEKKIEF
jgi:hypothetical protein